MGLERFAYVGAPFMNLFHHLQRGFGWGIGKDLARVLVRRMFG